MRILKPVLLLLLGFAIGWVTASVIAHRNIQRIMRGWSPEFQAFVAENVEFTKSLTKDEMEQLRIDIHDYGKHAVKELQIETLWQAMMAAQIKHALESGDTNKVNEMIDSKLARLKEEQAEGLFKGTDWEEVADSMVLRMSETNLPTVPPAVP